MGDIFHQTTISVQTVDTKMNTKKNLIRGIYLLPIPGIGRVHQIKGCRDKASGI